MTVTQPNDRKFGENDDIGWGKHVNVSLTREPAASFGVCIVGGKVNISKDLQVSGIFIKNIVPSSPADKCKLIKIGDRILSVNDQDVRKATQEETINLIKNAGCSLNLVLQSFDFSGGESETTSKASTTLVSPKPDNNYDTQHNEPAAANETTEQMEVEKIEKRVTIVSDEEQSSDEEESEDEETAGKVVSKAGVEIDRKSAGNIKRSREEIAADEEPENNFGYTEKKIKKKYGALGNIVRAYIQRDGNSSMGLALAGYKDRNKMGCFVAGINPKGTASSQNIKVGDEILEINGVVLHKLCHLNASVIIKGIPGTALEFILLRKSSALDELAVKPVISFPTVIDQFDQLYSCFKNVRNVTIQKVGTSLGIMIIEGKHSEVGQGIFISDIQENSNAEVAGVKIGEMILAVNKDLLIDCNYDAAAALLKRAEGIVTLILCNPNKKEDVEVPKEAVVVVEKAKTPEPPPVPEVPKDPATAPITPNKETLIELNAENKPLGIIVVKGDSSSVQAGASIIVIHENGAINKDKRFQVLDKILEIDGKKVSSETSDKDLKKLFKQTYGKVKMLVYRADPPDLKEVDVEVTRKSGKDLGVSFAECKGYGLYVTEITQGGVIDSDRRVIKGDIVTHINGDDIRSLSFIDSLLTLKAAQPKFTFKIVRPKGKK
ncbi:Inactivation-no-after-potential D protein [Pseudolycoriella hygida]|uniref:Inactivation-no-after-potential D protein n=1 Tax=Pseudolycoriella hygida TaxID=35572 RepID=A0A9Q0N6I7_9DIPT|nr:Inactivation-no-after-potential D protein [Pseudolycoriella hygida]